VTTLVFAAAAVLVFLAPGMTGLLEFDRSRIVTGEWWRLATGHFAHGSAEHLAWDVLAFVVLGAACERIGRSAFLATLAAASIAIGAAVLVFERDLEIYRGLSGVDSALFGWLLATLGRRARAEKRSGLLLVAFGAGALFVAKSVFELTTGSAVFVTGNETTVASAHVVGVVVGMASSLLPFFRAPVARLVRREAPNTP